MIPYVTLLIFPCMELRRSLQLKMPISLGKSIHESHVNERTLSTSGVDVMLLCSVN